MDPQTTKDQYIDDLVVSVMHDIRRTPMEDLIIYKGPLYQRLTAMCASAYKLGEDAGELKETLSQQDQLKDVTALVVDNHEKEESQA